MHTFTLNMRAIDLPASSFTTIQVHETRNNMSTNCASDYCELVVAQTTLCFHKECRSSTVRGHAEEIEAKRSIQQDLSIGQDGKAFTPLSMIEGTAILTASR